MQLEGNKFFQKPCELGNSLAVQWLGLHAFTAEGPGSISGGGTKILQAVAGKKKKCPVSLEEDPKL